MTDGQDFLMRLQKKRSKGDVGRMIWQLGWYIGQLQAALNIEHLRFRVKVLTF
jgi:hypothetical protein